MDDIDRAAVNGIGRRLAQLELRVDVLQLLSIVALILAVVIPLAVLLAVGP